MTEGKAHDVAEKTDQVFISYTERGIQGYDKNFAIMLNRELKKLNIETWFAPEKIVSGTDYRTYIAPAVRGSKVVVCILSKISAESEQVLFELDVANQNHIHVIPVLMPDMSPKMLENVETLYHELMLPGLKRQWTQVEDCSFEADVNIACAMIEAVLSGKEPNSNISRYSREKEKSRVLQDLLDKKTVNMQYSAFTEDKDFIDLIKAVSFLQKKSIDSITLNEANESLKKLLTIKDNSYIDIRNYMILIVLICYFQKKQIHCGLINIVEFLKTIKQPLIGFKYKMIVSEIECSSFKAIYYSLKFGLQ
jgi:hypothetical protein